MREIHIHIPAGFAEGQELHIHLDDSEPEQQPATPERQPATPERQPALSDPVEEMLQRLYDSRSAPRCLRDTVAELRAMGYELGVPAPHRVTGQREKYIAVIDPAAPKSYTAIMRPAYLIFDRVSDREVLAALPGAVVRDKGDVKFAIDGQHELKAARTVKR
jgi:hypothetical protein